ncbi:MAG: hypothetical protein WCR30_01585 [Clostridia bacterium]
MKNSNVCNKKVVAIFENQVIGTIESIMLSKDSRRVVGFCGKEQSGETFFIELRRIFSFGENAIMLRNTTHCIKSLKRICKPFNMGASLLSISGTSFGNLIDIEFDERGHDIKLVSNNGTKISPSQIVCEDKEMIIFCTDTKKALHTFKPRIRVFAQRDEQEIMVRVLEEQKNAIEITPAQNEQKIEEQPKIKFNPRVAVPSRVLSSSELLIGKKAITNILGLNNELILRKGQTITEKIIAISKQHGKLRELMLLSE